MNDQCECDVDQMCEMHLERQEEYRQIDRVDAILYSFYAANPAAEAYEPNDPKAFEL